MKVGEGAVELEAEAKIFGSGVGPLLESGGLRKAVEGLVDLRDIQDLGVALQCAPLFWKSIGQSLGDGPASRTYAYHQCKKWRTPVK